MSDPTGRWAVVVNTPGHLPDGAPTFFDSWADARDALANRLAELADEWREAEAGERSSWNHPDYDATLADRLAAAADVATGPVCDLSELSIGDEWDGDTAEEPTSALDSGLSWSLQDVGGWLADTNERGNR